MPKAVTRSESSTGALEGAAQLRIGILIVARDAASTLGTVLDRISASFRSRITEVFVGDGAGGVATRYLGQPSQQITSDLPLTIIRQGVGSGHGGSQKAGYRLAIEHGLDILVVLHAGGEDAPENLEELVAPLERGECDAVFGSRMMVTAAARRGGMTLPHYLGNRILTRLENRMLGTNLSEFDSGYRAYSVRSLASIPFERNSDDFDFDTELAIQLIHAGRRVVEVPVPTPDGGGMGHGLKYAREVSMDVLRYWSAKRGFLSNSIVEVGPEYELKEGEGGSHTIVLRWMERMQPARVLDLGCSGGLLAERVRSFGHRVTGVDFLELPGVRDRVDDFVSADLDRGLPTTLIDQGPYDVVIAADVLEHLRKPDRLLDQIRSVLAPGGTLIVSVPNIGHWYSRGRIALGLFDYDQRGILDLTHLRFFTRRSLLKMLRQAGFRVLQEEATGLPLEILAHGTGLVAGAARALDRVAVDARPTLFGYQFVCRCALSAEGTTAGRRQ